jgi:hypothetical protein
LHAVRTSLLVFVLPARAATWSVPRVAVDTASADGAIRVSERF